MKTPVLTVNQAYALAIQEESQRALGVIDNYKEPLTMFAGRGQNMKGKKPDLICEHCGYKGPLRKNSDKIVGYPAEFKSKKKNLSGGVRSYAHAVSSETSGSSENAQGHFFIEDQYK